MEISDENSINLEYMLKNSSDQLSEGRQSVHTSNNSIKLKIEFDNQIKENEKLSFFKAYASTARHSDLCYSSSIKFSKDSVIFENDEIYVSKEVDFKWLSEKLSSIGKIDSIADYEDLISGYNNENFQCIMLTIKNIRLMNKRLEYYLKECFMSSGSFKALSSNLIKLSGSQTEFSRSEIIRTFELAAINSEIEHQERMLLLIYLLKHSYEREEQEIFTEIVKFLFHLSELRRFNDAFLSTLDDIHYFGVKKPNNRNHTEIQYLIEILDSEFMKTSVSPRIQLFYIAFLSNLLCCAKCKISLTKYYSNQSDAEYKNEDIDEYSLWINFIKEKLHGFISENSNSEDSFFYRSLQDWNNDSSNYIMIAFISLMKLCDNEDEIISAMNQYRIPEIITNESVFKSSLVTIEDSCKSKLNNLSHISFNTFIFSSFINLYVSNLIRIGVQIDQELKSLPKEKDQKGFLMGLMDKIQRLDQIACVADLKMLKYFNPEKGYSIKQDLYTGSNDTEDEGFYFCEESESEKTNLRETETTLGAQISKNEQILDYYGAMSIAVNVESKFGTENEQSFSTHSRLKKSSKLRNGLTSTSCKPCCSIF